MDNAQAPPADSKPEEKVASDLLNLESLIKNYSAQIGNFKKELKKLKEILVDALSQDAVYKEHDEKVKEANRVRLATKLQILKQPSLAEVAGKIEAIRDEIDEQQEVLSDYLLQYLKISGVNEIEGEDGETQIIVSSARLVKGTPKFRP